MNKAELIDAVQNNLGGETTKRHTTEAVAAVLEALATGIQSGKPVQLIGFGTFKIVERAAREGRNPKSGQPMQIGASKTVRFTPSSNLKASLSEGGEKGGNQGGGGKKAAGGAKSAKKGATKAAGGGNGGAAKGAGGNQGESGGGNGGAAKGAGNQGGKGGGNGGAAKSAGNGGAKGGAGKKGGK